MLVKGMRVVEWALWLGVVVLLPFTSMPLLRNLFGSAMVAPASVIPLLGLVLLYFLPYLARGGRLAPQSKPLLGFAALALIASLTAYTISFPIFHNVDLTREMLKAGLTLAVGLCFFLVSSTWASDEKRLQATLRWINWSGLILLAWSITQGVVTRVHYSYPGWMDDLQAMFSSNQLFYERATGFAFEPSWLAHQLNMLYLPLWLAASVRRSSAHRLRLLGITFENVLLLAGFGVLWLTTSRIGLVAFLLTIAYLLVLANLWLMDWLQNRLLPRLRLVERWNHLIHPGARIAAVQTAGGGEGWLRLARPLLRLELIALLVVVYAGILFSSAQVLSRVDARMKTMFDFSAISNGGLLAYANQLVFAERIVFWQVGWEVFNDHPLLGVGLGNAGYYFEEKMSAYGWALPETTHIIYVEPGVPNTKSLWTRLLAETGLAGFGAFLCWLLVIFLTGRSLDQGHSRMGRAIGLAAQMTVLALFLEGFSVDTFALPYFWITFGLATAAWKICSSTPGLSHPAIFKSTDLA